MIKRLARRIRLNFKQTNSERKGQNSYRQHYRNVGKYLKEKVKIFKRTEKEKLK